MREYLIPALAVLVIVVAIVLIARRKKSSSPGPFGAGSDPRHGGDRRNDRTY